MTEVWFLVLFVMGLGGTSQTVPTPSPSKDACVAATEQSIRVARHNRQWELTQDLVAFCVKGASR